MFFIIAFSLLGIFCFKLWSVMSVEFYESRPAKHTLIAYHEAITNKEYHRAYSYLTLKMQNVIGNEYKWTQGYSNTISSVPVEINIIAMDNENYEWADLYFVLKSIDNINGQMVERCFHGYATVRKINSKWYIDSIRDVKLTECNKD